MSLRQQFVIKSTPQIVEIIESVLDLTSCRDKSLLFHRLLLPHIKEVVESDLVKSDCTIDGSLYREIETIFNNYIEG